MHESSIIALFMPALNYNICVCPETPDRFGYRNRGGDR